MNHNATGYLTAQHRGRGVYTFILRVVDVDFEQAAKDGGIIVAPDYSHLTPRARETWERLAASDLDGVTVEHRFV